MSQDSTATPSNSNYQSIFDSALEAYKKKTNKDLRSHPLLVKLETCDSPNAVLTLLREQIPGFDQSRSADDRLTKWLSPTVNVLYSFSGVIGGGIGLVYPPAGVIFTGIGVLLSAAKVNSASQAALGNIFERIETFFRRLETYIKLPPTTGMTEVIVKIVVEVLSILAIATKEIKQSRAKKYLKRLVGRSDIEDALGRLDRLTQEEVLMTAAQGLEATHVVIGGMEKVTHDIDRQRRNQIRHDLRNWLSPPDPSVNYNIATRNHHEGTALWFIQGNTFIDWKASGSLLWVHGKPGSGKSVLSSSIIQDIEGVSNAGSAHIAYFFFDFRDDGKQDVRALLSSLVVQLSHQSDPLCDILFRYHSSHKSGLQQPSDRALTQCLVEMLSIPGQVPIYLIFDALDECPNTTGISSQRDNVLSLVEKLIGQNLPNLRLCITSRPEADIRTALEPLTHNRICLHDQSGQKKDIVDFVTSVVYSNNNMRRWRDEDRKLVIETLSERANGMFRWVVCQLEVLRQCLAPSVRRILGELPETLDETYERILHEIPKSNREHAHRLLQCLTVAVRPLWVEELAEVLAVEFETTGGIPRLNEDLRWEDQEQAVLTACSSLIAIIDDDGSRVVQFAHFSVKEFLTSDRLATSKVDSSRYHHVSLGRAHTIMAQICLSVLLRLDSHRASIENFPLALYAALNFGDHAEFEDVLSNLQGGIDDLLDADKPHFAAWLRARRPLCGYPDEPYSTPLYHVAEAGFRGLVHHLVSRRPEDLGASGEYGTPLHAALYRRHGDVAELLLGHCVNVDVRGYENMTPLHMAALTGLPKVTRMLIERHADINSRDSYGMTPLHRVANHLYLATEDSFVDVARILLEHGAHVDAQADGHLTPLNEASYQGSVEIAQLLFEHGANIHVRNTNGQTLLHRACENLFDSASDRYFDAIQFLLERGADVDTHDNDHSTPLHMISSQNGSVRAAKLLLEHGANVHIQNNEGKTPIEVASMNGHEALTRLLSEYLPCEQRI